MWEGLRRTATFQLHGVEQIKQLVGHLIQERGMKPEVKPKLREILGLQRRALSFLQNSSSIIENLVDAVELRKATPLRKSTEATGAARKRGGGTPQKSLPPENVRRGKGGRSSRRGISVKTKTVTRRRVRIRRVARAERMHPIK